MKRVAGSQVERKTGSQVERKTGSHMESKTGFQLERTYSELWDDGTLVPIHTDNVDLGPYPVHMYSMVGQCLNYPSEAVDGKQPLAKPHSVSHRHHSDCDGLPPLQSR